LVPYVPELKTDFYCKQSVLKIQYLLFNAFGI
jgi:hypothetical protein